MTTTTEPHDSRLRAWGFAPGLYEVTCADCGLRVEADKRARRCRPCAVAAMRGEPLVLKVVDLVDAGVIGGRLFAAAIGKVADFRVGEVVVDTEDRRWRLQAVMDRADDPHPARNAILVGVAA